MSKNSKLFKTCFVQIENNVDNEKKKRSQPKAK